MGVALFLRLLQATAAVGGDDRAVGIESAADERNGAWDVGPRAEHDLGV